MDNRRVTYLFVMLAGVFMGTYAQNNTTETTATPITPNSTVTVLTTTISSTNCSKTQLCAAQPSGCDPTGTGCFFLSVQQQSGQNFGFALSGESDGYIAATLSNTTTPGNNGTTFVCANNNGVVKYFSAVYNNGKLTTTTLPVNNVQGKVNGKKIQCTFSATVPDSSARAAAAFSISVSTGSYNATSDALGDPSLKITTNVVDLTNPNATITNQTVVETTTTTTTAPSITPNSTVTNLTTTISSTNCSKTQLCAAQPSGCDPTGTGCFFLSVQQQSGQNFGFALSGESDGYIAAILAFSTTPGNNATTFVCANNNGVVKYFSAVYNNGKLTTTTLPVNNVQGKVNGKKIQCTFAATVPDSSARAAAAFSISVSTGSYNATSDALGDPSLKITTNVVDLTNPNATITNLITSTNNAVTTQQSLMKALLITVGVLSLTML